MHAAADRPEFAPPPQPGVLRAIGLALLAHALLIVALTFGLRWKSDTVEIAAEAELWSAVPQQAAPQAVEPPPPPPAPATPAPPPPPPPPPQPAVREQPRPEPPARRDAEIALEQQKKAEARRKEEELERRRERAQLEARRKQEELERRRELEQQKEKAQLEARRKQEELERQREKERQKAQLEAAQRKKDEELKKREAAKQLAEARKKEDDRRKAREEAEAKLAQMRADNLKRIQGLAGASGSPGATGSATQSSGPSASWAGRVRARVKPNIVFTDDVSGNPTAEVEVRMAPDGTIVGKKLVKASGVRSWDEAVLRALDKTEVLPRDTDGRVHSPVNLVFRPRD